MHYFVQILNHSPCSLKKQQHPSFRLFIPIPNLQQAIFCLIPSLELKETFGILRLLIQRFLDETHTIVLFMQVFFSFKYCQHFCGEIFCNATNLKSIRARVFGKEFCFIHTSTLSPFDTFANCHEETLLFAEGHERGKNVYFFGQIHDRLR